MTADVHAGFAGIDIESEEGKTVTKMWEEGNASDPSGTECQKCQKVGHFNCVWPIEKFYQRFIMCTVECIWRSYCIGLNVTNFNFYGHCRIFQRPMASGEGP